jgi:hypothetical protein
VRPSRSDVLSVKRREGKYPPRGQRSRQIALKKVGQIILKVTGLTEPLLPFLSERPTQHLKGVEHSRSTRWPSSAPLDLPLSGTASRGSGDWSMAGRASARWWRLRRDHHWEKFKSYLRRPNASGRPRVSRRNQGKRQPVRLRSHLSHGSCDGAVSHQDVQSGRSCLSYSFW